MAQIVERPALGFGSGRDPGVVGSSLASGSTLSMAPAWGSLALSRKKNFFFLKENFFKIIVPNYS